MEPVEASPDANANTEEEAMLDRSRAVVVCSVLVLASSCTSDRVVRNEATALGTLHVVSQMIECARRLHGQYPRDLRQLQVESAACFTTDADKSVVESLATSGRRGGYGFVYLPSQDASYYEFTAKPIAPGESGERFFWLDSRSLEVHASDTGPADSSSPVLERWRQ